MVGIVGLEPTWQKPTGFEPAANTSSAISPILEASVGFKPTDPEKSRQFSKLEQSFTLPTRHKFRGCLWGLLPQWLASIPTHDGTAEPSLSNVCHIVSDTIILVADVGFEPTDPVKGRRFSKALH